jgi:hypothetical protein
MKSFEVKKGIVMRKLLILSAMMIFMTACVTTPIEELPDPTPEVSEPQPEIEVLPPYRFALTGVPTDLDSTRAVAVMIGNTPEARPHAGLSQADIVYEIMVEYQVTRYMAIFDSRLPEKVGPIRSVRMPFAQKIEELKVGIAHYGGASVGLGDALGYLDRVKPPIRYDGVGGINTAFFFRSTDRKAPHNAYINLAKAIERAPEMELDVLRYEYQNRSGNEQGQGVQLRYSRGYAPSYVYLDEQQVYQRFYNGLEQLDANTNEPILVKNIIIQHVKHRTAESVGYVLVEFVGSGKAEYLIQGHYVEGTWERATLSDRTIYKDDQGQEILLEPGNTWIQVVLSSTTITFE